MAKLFLLLSALAAAFAGALSPPAPLQFCPIGNVAMTQLALDNSKVTQLISTHLQQAIVQQIHSMPEKYKGVSCWDKFYSSSPSSYTISSSFDDTKLAILSDGRIRYDADVSGTVTGLARVGYRICPIFKITWVYCGGDFSATLNLNFHAQVTVRVTSGSDDGVLAVVDPDVVFTGLTYTKEINCNSHTSWLDGFLDSIAVDVVEDAVHVGQIEQEVSSALEKKLSELTTAQLYTPKALPGLTVYYKIENIASIPGSLLWAQISMAADYNSSRMGSATPDGSSSTSGNGEEETIIDIYNQPHCGKVYWPTDFNQTQTDYMGLYGATRLGMEIVDLLNWVEEKNGTYNLHGQMNFANAAWNIQYDLSRPVISVTQEGELNLEIEHSRGALLCAGEGCSPWPVFNATLQSVKAIAVVRIASNDSSTGKVAQSQICDNGAPGFLPQVKRWDLNGSHYNIENPSWINSSTAIVWAVIEAGLRKSSSLLNEVIPAFCIPSATRGFLPKPRLHIYPYRRTTDPCHPTNCSTKKTHDNNSNSPDGLGYLEFVSSEFGAIPHTGRNFTPSAKDAPHRKYLVSFYYNQSFDLSFMKNQPMCGWDAGLYGWSWNQIRVESAAETEWCNTHVGALGSVNSFRITPSSQNPAKVIVEFGCNGASCAGCSFARQEVKLDECFFVKSPLLASVVISDATYLVEDDEGDSPPSEEYQRGVVGGPCVQNSGYWPSYTPATDTIAEGNMLLNYDSP